jgi:mycobactin peptide synthetase MbtE
VNLLKLVNKRAREVPDALAVSGPDGKATYGQMMARTLAMARAFESLGVGAGDRVGVVLVPGRDAICASLAALARRAAWVPVDPGQPPQRAVAALGRCQARLCVGYQVPGWEEAALRTPESLAGPWSCYAGAAVPDLAAGSGGDVAYVIHTSGSTGVPKGIEIEHDSVHSLLVDLDDRAPVSGRAVGSWWCSPDFDVSVWESWSMLHAGGTVVIPSAADRSEPARFAAFLDQASVTSAYVPHAYLPALLHRFVAHPDSCRTLRRLVVGIEPIELGLLQDLMRQRPALTIINGYGPAEATVFCTLYRVPPTGGDRAERTPIGTAVRGNTVSLLDTDGRATGSDDGELLIAGPAVARGYVDGTPDQLARFTTSAYGRAYRTGDRVRRLPDGNHQFVGRIDFQMKVRGYRVEPGEVETAIRTLGTIREVAVGKRIVPGTGDAIVAYVVPQPSADFDPHQTRARLRDMLPDYALPTVFFVLDEIPVTASQGKIDRSALAAMPLPDGTARADIAALANGQDSPPWPGLLGVVIDSWRGELGQDVPAELGFVDAGGTSLPAVRVAHVLQKATGKMIAAADVLAARSPGELAAKIAEAAPEPIDGPTAAGRREGPLSPNQLGMWLDERMSQEPSPYLEPYCFALPTGYDQQRLAGALERAIAAHPTFSATTRELAGEVRLVLGQHRIGMRLVDLPPHNGAQARNAALERELAERFALDGGALMRCVLMHDEQGPDLLLLIWHPIVVDGWSVRVFLDDLSRCYADAAHEPEAPAPTACDVNTWLDEQSKLAETVARTEQIAAAIGVIADVTCRHPGARGHGQQSLRLDGEVMRKLRAASQCSHLLPSTFLFTAYQHALLRTLDTDRLVFGCAVAARDRAEFQRLAGWYMNVELAATTATTAAPTVATAHAVEADLRRTHLEQKDLPVSLIAYQLRRLGRQAPQIIASIDEDPTLRLGGTACEAVPVPLPRLVRDATLSLSTKAECINGFFQHKLSLLDATEARTLLDTFGHSLNELTEAALGRGLTHRRHL